MKHVTIQNSYCLLLFQRTHFIEETNINLNYINKFNIGIKFDPYCCVFFNNTIIY